MPRFDQAATCQKWRRVLSTVSRVYLVLLTSPALKHFFKRGSALIPASFWLGTYEKTN